MKKEKSVAVLAMFNTEDGRLGGKGGKRKIVRYAHLFNTEEEGK